MKKTGVLLALPAVIFLIVFFFAPFVFLIYKSFQSNIGILTIQNYLKVLTDTFYIRISLYSLEIALITTLLCILIAYPASYYLVHVVSDKYRGIVLAILISPFWIDFLIRAYALKAFFFPLGIKEGFFTLIYGMVYDYFLFMLLPLYASMTGVSKTIINAARIQGASGLTLARKIVIPLTIPGLVAGSTIVFMMSLTEFVIPAMLGGTSGYTLGYTIYDLFFIYRDIYRGSALSVIISALSLLVAYYYIKKTREQGGIFA
ncbi:MAG: ABC transporter permease [Fervidicoccaceae archaeon]